MFQLTYTHLPKLYVHYNYLKRNKNHNTMCIKKLASKLEHPGSETSTFEEKM